jgi:hypothetical protein
MAEFAYKTPRLIRRSYCSRSGPWRPSCFQLQASYPVCWVLYVRNWSARDCADAQDRFDPWTKSLSLLTESEHKPSHLVCNYGHYISEDGAERIPMMLTSHKEYVAQPSFQKLSATRRAPIDAPVYIRVYGASKQGPNSVRRLPSKMA